MSQHDTETTKSEDQREVEAYFASSRYARTQTQSWQREQLIANLEVGEAKSLFKGVGGLAGFVLIFGAMMPLGMELVENVFAFNQPRFVIMTIVLQTLLFPPVVCFAFATVTPMFWYGSLFLRFAMASLSVMPGCIAFMLLIAIFESGADDVWKDIFAVLFPYFLTAATIALGVQLWSPWTMTHAREHSSQAPPPTGLRSMIELTAIAAVGCAVLASIDLMPVLEGVLFFACFSVLASIAIISVLIIAMGERRRRMTAAIVAAAFAFCAAAFVNGFFAVMEFGWYALAAEVMVLGFVSTYGCVVICALMALCVWWLQGCGWTCINRRAQRELHPSLPDPLD